MRGKTFGSRIVGTSGHARRADCGNGIFSLIRIASCYSRRQTIRITPRPGTDWRDRRTFVGVGYWEFGWLVAERRPRVRGLRVSNLDLRILTVPRMIAGWRFRNQRERGAPA
ncbi:hypothetical protein STAQ_18610 [Allostella sp. ATCC 35155]|nr:hypothetical protein STAQ_18610 [Stella sp. ATCC 35155]